MKKTLSLFLLLVISSPALARRVNSFQDPAQTQSTAPLTNHDVLGMLKAGLSSEIVIAKIKTSATKFDTTPAGLQELKAANVPDAVILAMLQPLASSSPNETGTLESKPTRLKDELTTAFTRLQTTVVTVWSEIGSGTGFIVDPAGLIMTNQHVIGPSEIISVQFDDKRKVAAMLLAADPEKDVAMLWVNLEAFPDATIAPFAQTGSGEPPVVEGERVFTIGSPLSQRKIMTSGIASKVEPRAIISDININHGNSGGPLFNSLGQVVGITTFGDPDRQGGPGLSGIVRIEEALDVLAQSRSEMAKKIKPEATLLPVEPIEPFPLDAIKAVAQAEKFDYRPYFFDVGDYDVQFQTPIVKYRIGIESELSAAKEKNKRNKKKDAVQDTFRPLDQFKNWAEYAGQYKAVLHVYAAPHLRESFWGAVGRGMAANYGLITAAKLRFKTDFYRMKLKCGEREVQPIQPLKIVRLVDVRNRYVNANDATYEGFYTYPADAISPACGQVTLELFSEKKPNSPTVRVLDPKTILRIAADFEPYRKAQQPSQ